jgi:hypothetical protein
MEPGLLDRCGAVRTSDEDWRVDYGAKSFMGQ